MNSMAAVVALDGISEHALMALWHLPPGRETLHTHLYYRASACRIRPLRHMKHIMNAVVTPKQPR